MFNEKTLELLIDKITEIQKLCNQYGLGNLRLIKPSGVDEWEKITVLGDENNKMLITSDLDFLRDQIKSLLDCEIMLVTDSMLCLLLILC